MPLKTAYAPLPLPGSFYPDDPVALRTTVESLLATRDCTLAAKPEAAPAAAFRIPAPAPTAAGQG
jgi:hypothetical protein